jgi:hypothetical protein
MPREVFGQKRRKSLAALFQSDFSFYVIVFFLDDIRGKCLNPFAKSDFCKPVLSMYVCKLATCKFRIRNRFMGCLHVTRILYKIWSDGANFMSDDKTSAGRKKIEAAHFWTSDKICVVKFVMSDRILRTGLTVQRENLFNLFDELCCL